MHVTFNQLCELVRARKRRIIERLSVKDEGTPLGGRFRSGDQKELIGKVLYDFAVEHGPMQINGMVIGVSPATRGFAGLRSTDSVKFRALIQRLQEEAMAGFATEVVKRWQRIKEASGVVRQPGRTSEVERFAGQRFRGFD